MKYCKKQKENYSDIRFLGRAMYEVLCSQTKDSQITQSKCSTIC